ncbi:hypothetical protein [Lutibacter sp. B1]|uniref:hypothetical protein n=1 Tax=Lutibacter sp. B1 TaxID=2725996 RepID=UPI001456D0C5|nr:hypothetical protein [Lutibacter sp. B1]NLP56768.1 hypothetical protein [Lutibacter sp. B1]
MKKLFQIVLVSSLSLLCFSCYYDDYSEEIIIDIPDDQPISFSSEIQPIFSKCTGCHGTNISPDLREGNSYNQLVPNYVTAGDAEGSDLYNYLPGNGHHDIGFTLSGNEIALIKAWIDQGALDN